jgi:hypothetical protein
VDTFVQLPALDRANEQVSKVGQAGRSHLDEFVFRFNRRKAKAISHGFARLIQHAVNTPPTTYRGIVPGVAA